MLFLYDNDKTFRHINFLFIILKNIFGASNWCLALPNNYYKPGTLVIEKELIIWRIDLAVSQEKTTQILVFGGINS